MVAAIVLPPGHHYHPQSSFSQHRLHHYSGPSITNMIPSVEPRKAHDSPDYSNRQSLPSISEVISGAKPPAPYPSAPDNMQTTSSLLSPFAPSTSHQFAASDKYSPPQPLHPASYPSRQEPLPALPDSPRPAFNGLPGLCPVSDRRPTKHEVPPSHLHELPQPLGAYSLNGNYPYADVKPLPPTSLRVSYQLGQLTHGTVPLPSHPISPRHVVPYIPGGYDPQGPPPPLPPHPEETEFSTRARYDRRFESGGYKDSLSRIGSTSRTIFNFAEAYGMVAQEQQRLHHIHERLPTEREVAEMLANNHMIKRSLEQVRDLVQLSIQSDRACKGTKIEGLCEADQDVTIYTNDVKPQNVTERKRPRVRTAPPGRCHSCNRIDTPEWRRGPEGARTLCNACGLHYAKLEKKRLLEVRSIRLKPEGRT